MFQTLVVLLVLLRRRYGSGVLVSLPAYLVSRLLLVLNTSERMIFQVLRSDHIPDALASLHLLRIPSACSLRQLC